MSGFAEVTASMFPCEQSAKEDQDCPRLENHLHLTLSNCLCVTLQTGTEGPLSPRPPQMMACLPASADVTGLFSHLYSQTHKLLKGGCEVLEARHITSKSVFDVCRQRCAEIKKQKALDLV